MANMKCTCGNRMSNVGCPNNMEGEIKGLYEYEFRTVWECENCGRLWIDYKDEQGFTKAKSYIPEDGKIDNLFNIGNSEQFVSYLKEIWKRNKEEFLKIEIGEL